MADHSLKYVKNRFLWDPLPTWSAADSEVFCNSFQHVCICKCFCIFLLEELGMLELEPEYSHPALYHMTAHIAGTSKNTLMSPGATQKLLPWRHLEECRLS